MISSYQSVPGEKLLLLSAQSQAKHQWGQGSLTFQGGQEFLNSFFPTGTLGSLVATEHLCVAEASSGASPIQPCLEAACSGTVGSEK